MEAMPTLQDLVGPALDRLEVEAKEQGVRWSVRALEKRYGIANGTLGQIAKGERTKVDGRTIPKIAKALGLDKNALFEAQVPREEPQSGADSSPITPPLSSGVSVAVVRDSDVELLDEAFDGAVHKPSDMAAVQRLLRERASLVVPGANPVQIVRRWLDMAARIRQRGEKATSSKIIAELTARVVELEEEKRTPPPLAVKLLQQRKRNAEE